jgi:SAM-dependent methyltransferase
MRCGTGEQTLLAAAHGAEATGVDGAPTAIERARAKAAERGITARFEVADVLDLSLLGMTFDTVIDSGVFHVFSDEDRPRYVSSLAAVLRDGGMCYLACFSDRQPGDWGPRRVSQDELRAVFSDGWQIGSIEAGLFEINPMEGSTTVQAWLASIRRSSLCRPDPAQGLREQRGDEPGSAAANTGYVAVALLRRSLEQMMPNPSVCQRGPVNMDIESRPCMLTSSGSTCSWNCVSARTASSWAAPRLDPGQPCRSLH